MQLEVGAVFEGKVTGITKFGAFVDFAEGKTGMVHISEVAPTFVKEIRDFVTEGQPVKVKIISISEDGKIALSMKRAEPQVERAPQGDRPPRQQGGFPPRQQGGFSPRQQGGFSPRQQGGFSPRQQGGGFRRPSAPPAPQGPARPGDFEWEARAQGGSFEDMMSRFKQTSDEKILDLKRSTDTKRGGVSRKEGAK